MLNYDVKFMVGEFEIRIIVEPVTIFFYIFRRLFVVSTLLVTVATDVNYSEARSLLPLFITMLLQVLRPLNTKGVTSVYKHYADYLRCS